MASAPGSHAQPFSVTRRRRGLRLRLKVLWRRSRLDAALALGCAPHVRPELELRARQLTSRRERSQLAWSLRRTVADAQRPPAGWPGASVPLRRATVRQWSQGLLGLADRLEAPEAISAAAIARVRALLTDGTGPLYSDHPPRFLDETIWWIADALQEGPPDDGRDVHYAARRWGFARQRRGLG